MSIRLEDIPQNNTIRLSDIPEKNTSVRLSDIPETTEASVGGFVKQAAIGFGNEMAMGFPLYALEKVKGKEARKAWESNNPVERFGRGVGTTVGMATVLPKAVFGLGVKGIQAVGKVTKASKITKDLLTPVLGEEKAKRAIRFGESAAKGASGIGAFELVHAPEDTFKEKLTSVPTAALFGAATFGAGDLLADPIKKFLIKRKLIDKGFIGGGDSIKKMNEMLSQEVSEESGVAIKTKRIDNMLETKVVDAKSPIRWLQEWAEDISGKSLKFSQKPYEASRNYSGIGGKINIYHDKLAKILNQDRTLVTPLNQMMTAERLLERARRGFKNPRALGEQDAVNIMGDLRKGLGNDNFAKVRQMANDVRGVTKDILFQLRETGVIDRQSLRSILKNNEFYSPFQVLSYLNENPSRFAAGRNAFNIKEPGFLKATEGTERDVESPINAVMRYIANGKSLVEKNNVVKKLVRLRKLHPEIEKVIVENTDNLPSGYDKIHVFQDGVKKDFGVPQEIADVVKGMNTETIDLMTRFARWQSTALRIGATTLSYPFIVRNLIRDAQTAAIVSKVGFNVGDWVKGFATAIRKGPEFDLFMKSGGSFGGMVENLSSGIRYSEKQLVPSISKTIFETLNPFHWIAEGSKLSENVTRLGVFTKGLKAGMPPPQAAFNARNSTIDFAKMGTAMRVWNMWVPFLNARTQGTLNFYNAAKTQPMRVALVGSGMIVTPSVSTYLWNQTQFPDVFKDIRRFEKDNNFIFIYGREKDEEGRWLNVAKIPKGDIGRIMSNPIESFLDFTYKNNPESIGELALQTLSDLSPIELAREGKLSGQAMASSITPPFVKGALETSYNKNFFTGRDIVPQYLQDKPPEEQYTIDTPPIAVKIGELFDISPMKVQNLAGTLFGTLGRQSLDPLNQGKSFGKIFSGAIGDEELQRRFDILQDIMLDTEAKEAQDYRFVRQALIDFKNIPAEPNLRKQFIRNRFKDNEKALEKFIDAIEGEQKGETWFDRFLKRRPANDKILFLKTYSGLLETEEQKKQFMLEILDKKIITENTLKDLE